MSGVNKLQDGSVTLLDGMNQFKDEGTGKLQNEYNSKIKTVMDRFKAITKDADDYKNGVSEIDDYFKSMSLGITAIVKDGDYTYHYFLVEDNDDYMTCLRYYPKTYEDNGDGYYNTIIKAGYYTFDQNTGDLDDIEWKDSKENKYTPKCIGNNTSSTED